MTRFVIVHPERVTDSYTGEISERVQLSQLLLTRPGGIIAGRNLYPLLAPMVNESVRDGGWTTSVHKQDARMGGNKRGGILYFTRLSYRFAKRREKGYRFRPGAIKWLVLNIELFTEDTDVEAAARALVQLAAKRGISPRYSPGSFGSALIRASPQWEAGRHAAPWFISEIARKQLPGNYYALRHNYRSVPRAYYLDQRSAHHTIAATIPIPHPHSLRARGFYRRAGRGESPRWVDGLPGHAGLLCCMVECKAIPVTDHHLFPKWARERGERMEWIWTPELRLLDDRVKVKWITAAFTAKASDPVLPEYARWALGHLATKPHAAVKPALLAGYGVLAVNRKPLQRYSVHGRKKPPRAEQLSLPLLDTVYRSEINRVRISAIQNVVARGVIEAEVRTRSIEYARQLESEGIPVVQIYADGLIAATEQLPILAPGWRVQCALTDVYSPSPNSIRSRELTRLPGIPNGRRTVQYRPSYGPRHVFSGKPVKATQ